MASITSARVRAAIKSTRCTQKEIFVQPEFITLPRQAIDITGQRFGRLVAIGPVGRYRNTQIVWLCQCDCGNTCTPIVNNLRKGKSKSCGCLRDDTARETHTKHGMKRHPLYAAWVDMNARCRNPNAANYSDYGGRNIKVCDKWRESFQAYHDYVTQLDNYGVKGCTLDRIDNDGNYEPDNMRWASDIEQARNKRNNRMITHDGKAQCLQAWAEDLQINRNTLKNRLNAGWDIEQVIVELRHAREELRA